MLQDASDETPYFSTELYQVTVPENVEDYIVTTVMVSGIKIIVQLSEVRLSL